jgi:hypothetical protein
MGHEFHMQAWIVPLSGQVDDESSVIFSFETELWDHAAAWEHFDETCHLDNNIKRTRVRVAFGMDACHRGILSITDGHKID